MPDENANLGDERDDDVFAVRVTATEEQAHELVSRGEFDFGDRPHFSVTEGGRGRLDLFVTRSQIDELRTEGYDVDIESNQSARWRERLGEVGRGDRFESGAVPPRGVGRKIGGHGRPEQPPPPTGSISEPEEGS